MVAISIRWASPLSALYLSRIGGRGIIPSKFSSKLIPNHRINRIQLPAFLEAPMGSGVHSVQWSAKVIVVKWQTILHLGVYFKIP
jgi:hypothetical protein